MKLHKIILAGLATLTLAIPFSQAEEAPASAKMLVYIHPQEYNSSIKLWQYYRDYWYVQGPLVEESAVKVLGKEFGDVAMCDDNQVTSNALVWLRPRMFYNPQMQTFYSKITAVAYTATGKPIATYVGEASKRGFLDVYTEKQIKELYDQSMMALVTKMKSDPNMQSALSTAAAVGDVKTPCSMVTLLPAPKVQFMSF